MKKTAITTMAMLLVAASAVVAAGDSGLDGKYAILTRRSIFSKTPIAPPTSQPATTQPASSVQSLVLTGVARIGEGCGFVAFIEDTSGGQTLRLKVGDSVGQGKLTQIGLDFIEYDVAGHPMRIEVGNTLGGTVADMPPTTSPAVSATSGDAGMSAIERMKRRRMREMQR